MTVPQKSKIPTEIYREITPLGPNDCFMIFSRDKAKFDFPLHSHSEIELNMVFNAPGAQRIIGSHIGAIDDMELVLVGSDVMHGWFNDKCASDNIHELTIQFHPTLFDEKFLMRNQMASLRKMFSDAKRGILFSRKVIEQIAPTIQALYNNAGFGSVIDLMSLLYNLSMSEDWKLLSDPSFDNKKVSSGSCRIERVFEYMNRNFDKHVSLADVARIANMSEVSFSRFIKRHTGFSFVETLNDIRLGHVTRMLIDTNLTIAEVALCCGFNNMANFNRIFKNKKGMTPNLFRQTYMPKKIYI